MLDRSRGKLTPASKSTFSEHLKEGLYDEKYSLLKSQRSISSPSREVKVNSKICRTESYLSPVYKVVIQAVDLLLSFSKD